MMPPAVRFAVQLNEERKSAKWRNERPMTLRVVPRASVPDPTTEDGALDAGVCSEICLATEAKCWAVEAHAPAHTPKKRRPAVDCTDGHSVPITQEDFEALRPHASDRQELAEDTCRERCKSEGCFLAGYEPEEVRPVHDDERLVLCGPTKIVGDDRAVE